jgi:hypothetical protein
MSGQHTIPPAPAANGPLVVERKIKSDGTVREYACELVHLDPALEIVRFHMAKGGVIFGTPIEVPPGSVSYGWFWARRPYNLYRMHTVDGRLIAHRFDAVADVLLSPAVIEYRDLVLDWWVAPDGTVIEEDRDEFDELLAAGQVSERDAAAAVEASRQVLSRYRHIIDEVEALERRFNIAVAG